HDQSRDQLTIFTDTIKWEKTEALLREAKRLSSWLGEEILSTGFVRNLLWYGQMYRSYMKEHKVIPYLRFLPLMVYDIARNLPPPDSREPEEREVRQWAEALRGLDKNNINLTHLTFLANYALNINRTA
ncbi:MAG: hypothetical protein ACK4WF_06385, partial [Candidatus Brocadiales bacterium]